MSTTSSAVLAFAERHLGDFRLRSGQIVAETCPFCHGGASHDKYTFAVGQYNGAYNCMRGSCGVHGSFKQLLEHFGEKEVEMNIPSFSSKQEKEYSLPSVELQPLTDEAEQWFAKRHISRETVEAFKIACDEKGNIVLPFYLNEELVFVKYRDPQRKKTDKTPKEWQEKNTKPILFNMDGCKSTEPLIITEGELDAMAIYEAGFHNVTSVPCGCTNFDWINLCWDWLETFNEIIIFGDSDEPGRAMVSTLIRRLGEERCMTPGEYPELIYNGVNYNKPCKDANEILICYGPDGIKNLIEECKPAPIKGVLNLADVEYVNPLSVPRILTGIPELDECIGGLSEGSVTVFTGKRGEGKSTFNGQLMLNAIEQGYKVCAYSGELSAAKFLEWIFLQATEQKYIDTMMDERNGKIYPVVSEEIQKRIRAYIDNKFFLFDNAYADAATQQKAILDAFDLCARKVGAKLFVVDNLMSALTSADEENKAQAHFTADLKTLAVKYKVAVVLVAHPRKTKAGEALTNDDVSGSSAITNLADTVIAVEKPDLNVTKNRDFGTLTKISCGYSPANRRIFSLASGDTFHYSWDHRDLTMPECPAIDMDRFRMSTSQSNGGASF